MQGLSARARGDHALAERRLHEAERHWRRLEADASGEFLSSLVDLGRPPVTGVADPATSSTGSPRSWRPMPTFDDSATSTAPVEEVWKLLYDPSRFPEWWEGVETVDRAAAEGFTLYPTGYPDFPMPQAMRTEGRKVTISCLVSHLVFEWRLRHAGRRHADRRPRRDPRGRGGPAGDPACGR